LSVTLWKFAGWLFLIEIVCASIIYLSGVGVLLSRVMFGMVMVVLLVVFVAIPFWIAYGEEVK